LNALLDIRGAGGKSSSTARTPVETPESLHSIAYAKIIDLISEGEIKGLVNGLQSVVLDGAPLQSSDGQMNFQNVTVQTRVGTQDQEYLAGFPSVENEVGVEVELRSDTPVVRTVSGSELSAVRIRLGVPGLQRTDTSNGDTLGYRITYAVDVSTDGGAYTTALTDTFAGKTTTEYERSRRIELPPGSVWQIRIRRLTPNANSATIADTTMVKSITEIIDAKLRYPNSALVALEVDASQFQSIPTRGYFCDWRIIRVPANYDPETRTYFGIWDGTFKSAWSNNPAWVFYDIVTNDRFGLGGVVAPEMVDRWRLYQIAQYCDQLVSDGHGGQEPRFTCNVYLQSQQDAYRVLQDLASVFRGISYYAMGQVLASADMPADPVYTYTAANVIEGRFKYEGTARKTRHTVALVSWNDPDDFGRQKVEPVVYREGVARYGIQQVEVSAFGCTSRGQAQRIGLHILLTENLETETVSFSVGLDGVVAEPGQIVQIADPHRAGRRTGGRIRSATGQTVVLDLVPAGMAIGDDLVLMLPSGRSEARTIAGIDGNAVTVSVPWTVAPRPQAVWATQSAELALQTFKVIAVTEGEGITYNITALKHVPQKFGAIDDGAKLELPPVSIIPPSVQPPPTNVVLSSRSMIEQGLANHTLTITWDVADKAIAYDVEWRRDDLDWVRAGRVSTSSMEIPGIYAGEYLARIRAVNALGAVSIPAMSALTTIAGKTTPPPALASLTASGAIFGIDLKWAFPPGATDTQRTEIWYSANSNQEDAIKLGDFAYPQATHSLMGLAAGMRFWFWGRLVDRSGNVGPWYPLGLGVVGESSSDAGPILDYLTGKIEKSQLGSALLSAIDLVDPYMAGDTLGFAGDNTRFAGAWTYVDAQQDGDRALATRIDTVAAQFDYSFALVQTQVTTAVTQSSAAATIATQAQAQVGDVSAVVVTQGAAIANLNGTVSSSWSAKVGITADGKYYAAGFAVGIDNSSGVVQSQFLVHADLFGVLNGTGAGSTVSSPFIITGGQVFIRSAFIQDGSITNAKIGDVIQSTATGAGGQPRWKLDKTGTLTMVGANGGSGYLTISDSVIRVYDGAGTLRVQMGIW